MAHMVKCLECGKNFEAQRKTAVFCSDVCRAMYAHREKRIRQIAEELFWDTVNYGNKLRHGLKPETRVALENAKIQIGIFLERAEKLTQTEE